jgi:hypothetical protein
MDFDLKEKFLLLKHEYSGVESNDFKTSEFYKVNIILHDKLIR